MLKNMYHKYLIYVKNYISKIGVHLAHTSVHLKWKNKKTLLFQMQGRED
jgi:hypothetical protein